MRARGAKSDNKGTGCLKSGAPARPIRDEESAVSRMLKRAPIETEPEMEAGARAAGETASSARAGFHFRLGLDGGPL